jgi:hypothetical protein
MPVYWDVTPCGSCENRRFGGANRLHHVLFLRSVLRLIVTANNVPISLSLVTLMIEAIHSSETFVLQEPHDVKSQMTAFFIVAAVKTPNLT